MPALSDLRRGDRGTIAGYEEGSQQYRAKLLSMGLTPGTAFSIIRYAPMGDPIEISVRGYHLSLRKGEAAVVRVRRHDDEEEVS